MANLYSVFGLSPAASCDAIKTGYYRLAKQCHPDTHAGETAEERIREINQAYETLGDPVARANYDVIAQHVRAVVALASGLGMQTTAEGVETQEQLDAIRSEGCAEMQGFLFSKPLPAHEIERLFLSKQMERKISGHLSAA